MYELVIRNNLQKKLYLMYSLNVIDWICTLILLSTGLFYEANPIARTFINSYDIGFVIKCILPLLIVLLICKLMTILDFAELKTADKVISFVLVVYIAIDLDHIVNFILLFLH